MNPSSEISVLIILVVRLVTGSGVTYKIVDASSSTNGAYLWALNTESIYVVIPVPGSVYGFPIRTPLILCEL
jgi:hypothetical protein